MARWRNKYSVGLAINRSRVQILLGAFTFTFYCLFATWRPPAPHIPVFVPDYCTRYRRTCKGKGKGFPYSIPSVGSGADPGVQAVSLQVTASHPPSGRLPLLSARPAVTSSAAEHHRPLAGTKLCCLVTEAHRCKQLAQGCYAALPRAGFEPATY